MSDTSPASFDDAYASLIAACDDALAAQTLTKITDDAPIAPELRSQVEDALDCIRMLRQHWPQPGDNSEITPGATPTIGRFIIRRELGYGSFGRVYLAYDPALARDVALKVPRFDAHTSPELRARFRREAQAAASLDHPHIVQVFEAGETGSVCYIASAFCSGPTLAAWMKQQTEPIPFRLAAEIVADLADAVEHAHQHGVLHRDLKPGNVLLSFSRESSASADTTLAEGSRLNGLNPKITDFGLAKIVAGSSDGATGPGYQTESGAMLGTPQYMAPEQAGGPKEQVQAPADTYALGAILYELLTGRPPFQADSVMELLFLVRSVEPVYLHRLRHGTPADLETICLKCLQKEPAKRYGSAGGLADDLRRHLNGEPIHARPVSWWEQTVKWAKRRPAVAGLTGAVAAALVLGAAVALVLAIWAFGERDRARLELANSLVSQAAAIQHTGQIGQRFESLRLLTAAASELRNHPQAKDRIPEIRNHAIAALGLTDLRVSWERQVGGLIGAQFDRALARYAKLESFETGKVLVRRIDDDAELMDVPHPGPKFWYAKTDFSPDGQYLLIGYWLQNEDNPLLHVWHINRKELVFNQRMSPGFSVWLLAALHPNGRWLIYAPPKNGLKVWDLVNHREIRQFHDGDLFSICIDSRGERVAVTEDEGLKVRILDLESGRELAAWRSPHGVGVLSWSADGKLLASGGGTGRTSVWHVPRKELVSVLRGHSAPVIHLQFAPSGYLLATTSWDRTTRLWDAISGETLVGAPGCFGRFSPVDSRLAFLNGTNLGVWDLTHGLECRTMHPGFHGNQSDDLVLQLGTEFHPDGTLLATGDRNGVRFWDVVTGEECAHMRTGNSYPNLFHPDGHCLITHSSWGTYRWPIRVGIGTATKTFYIGPPELLPVPLPRDIGWQDAKWMPGHRALVVNDRAKSRVVITDLPDEGHTAADPVVLKSEHNRTISVSVSPNGKWLACGGWKTRDIPIWNVPERRRERVLPPGNVPSNEAFLAYFSPDGRWLVSATSDEEDSDNGYHFWRTGTWDKERFIPAKINTTRAAFTADGRAIALSVTPEQILLADPADGRELARLSTLLPIGPWPAAFSPDGSRLAAITGRQTILVWDLQRIREQLATMDLDWEAPPLPPRPVPHYQQDFQVHIIGEVPEPAKEDM